MNSNNENKFSHIKRRNLFLEMEECKTNIEKDFNNDKIINENAKTYNDYHWRLKLISNNLDENIKTNEEILENESHSTEKNEDENILTENKNDDDNNNSSNEEATNKSNNDLEIMDEKENDFKIKQIVDNNDNDKSKKEDEIIPDILSPVKIDLTKNQNFNENNKNDNKEKENINIDRKPLIQKPNILNSSKIQKIKQKLNQRKNKYKEDDENAKNNDIKPPYIFQLTAIKNEENNKNSNFNDNSNENNTIKNKIYNYLTKDEDWKNNKNSKYNYNKMRLNLLRRKIRYQNQLENINDSERTYRLTYTGLKRYQNISLSNLSEIQKGIHTYYMINDNINKVNNIRREIKNITKTDNAMDINKNQKISDILKRNKGIEDIFTSIVKPNINNQNKMHYNKILNQLNKTIEKLSKNEGNNDIKKLDSNKNFRRYSYTKINEITQFEKNRKSRMDFFNKINYTNIMSTTNMNDKNKKLIFESKMVTMNNTINQLLKMTPDFYKEKKITLPANNFRKTKSISKIYNNKENNRALLI